MGRKPYRKEKPAEGVWDGSRLKISIGFNEHDFENLGMMARLNGVSFQEQVRQICRKYIDGDKR